MKTIFRTTFFTLILLFLLAGCRSTRRVPDGQYLLLNNKIKVDNLRIKNDDLKAIIKQKPNRKILGLFRFHLGVYNFAANGKQSKFRNWLTNTVGEKPVIYDSLLTKKSARQLELYLKKKGYFHAFVVDSTKYHKKKAEVYYRVITNHPYTFSSVNYSVEDITVSSFILPDTLNSLIKSGDVYDEDVISAERERLTNLLKNEGYFDFAKEYISFEADSSEATKKVSIRINIENPKAKVKDSLEVPPLLSHQRFLINNIFIYTDFVKSSGQYTDTINVSDYKFIYNKEQNFKPGVIVHHTFIKKGDLFRQRNVEETYKKLNDLRVFKIVNIYFKKDSLNGYLNAYMELTPLIRQDITLEPEGYFRSGSPGIAGNIVYTNRNTLRGAENLEVRLKGSLEAQQVDKEAAKEGEKVLFFNTQEFGPEVKFTVPKFLLLPIKQEKFSKYFTPQTTFTASFNYQLRPDLTRKIVNLTYGYTWRNKLTRRHIFNPLEVNYVDVVAKESLEKILEQFPNQIIRRSFEPHVTISSKYTFIYNNQGLKKARSYFFFRGSIEGAGNMLRGANVVLDEVPFFEEKLNIKIDKDTNGSYTFATLPFAQFLKIDADLRYYHIFHEKHNVATRVAIGVGKPWVNLQALPLEKSYFAGGANSIRAWAARSLGPGSYDANNSQEANSLRIGDISFETNIEYRFDLFKIVEGALFADAGNIWLFPKDATDTRGSVFDKNFWLRQMALGAGAGIRLDFTFFIFRFDAGLKVFDPMQPTKKELVIRNLFNKGWKDKYQLENGTRYQFHNFNIGIGYPF